MGRCERTWSGLGIRKLAIDSAAVGQSTDSTLKYVGNGWQRDTAISKLLACVPMS